MFDVNNTMTSENTYNYKLSLTVTILQNVKNTNKYFKKDVSDSVKYLTSEF